MDAEPRTRNRTENDGGRRRTRGHDEGQEVTTNPSLQIHAGPQRLSFSGGPLEVHLGSVVPPGSELQQNWSQIESKCSQTNLEFVAARSQLFKAALGARNNTNSTRPQSRVSCEGSAPPPDQRLALPFVAGARGVGVGVTGEPGAGGDKAVYRRSAHSAALSLALSLARWLPGSPQAHERRPAVCDSASLLAAD